MDNDGVFWHEYVFFGGKRVAMRNVPNGTISYYEEDMLGSSRTERGLPGRRLVEPGGSVQAGQTSPCYDADFYPFGGERIITNTCTQNYKFEGKERDTETGNDAHFASRMRLRDDFGARKGSQVPGKGSLGDKEFFSPGPLALGGLVQRSRARSVCEPVESAPDIAEILKHLIWI